MGYTKPKNGEWILRDGWTFTGKKCARGHLAPRNRFGQCVQCYREYRAKRGHFSKTPASIEWREKNARHLADLKKSHHQRRPDMKMINSARKVAKSKGLPFDLEAGCFNLPEVCPVLGIQLDYSLGQRHGATASLDRIVPAKGYTQGNVIVVSWRANHIKCDATVDELEAIARFYKGLTGCPSKSLTEIPIATVRSGANP